jgi:Protein of unknown function (DUF3738)
VRYWWHGQPPRASTCRRPDPRCRRLRPGGRVSATNNSLRNIIRNAYNVQNYQIIGGPDWINTARWDITAKAPETLDLTWTPEEAPPGPGGTSAPPPPSSDTGALYTAVQEQLGLKLDAQRGAVDLLLIESVERPVQD